MDNNSFFKYVFVVVVIFLIIFTGYILIKNNSKSETVTLDQTSTTNLIQTDLRFAIAGIDTINPILSNNRNVIEITKIIYEPLVTLNENFKLEYCLANEVAKIDNLTYVLKLRKNVLWQDGSEFNAEDVKFTIDTIKNTNTIYGENLKYVTGLEIIDAHTVKIILSEEVHFFEYNLTFPIMCQKYYEEDFVNKIPIGTGLFQIASIENNIIKLVKNENYWNTEKKPMVKEININLYGTIGEVYNAFKSGDIDILNIKIPNVENYIGTIGYNRIEYKTREYDFLSFNTLSPMFIEPEVRRALSLIIDKNALIAICLGSGYVVSNFSLDMGNWLYTRDLNVISSTEEASQILEADEWQYRNNTWQKNIDGRIVTLAFTITVNNNNAKRVQVAENIAEQFRSFGIYVNVNQISPERYIDALNNKNYECILAGLELGFSPNLDTFFGNGNIANYSNPEVMEIMNIVSNATDESILYEKYNRLYDIYLSEAPYIGLYRTTDLIICHQGLVGNIRPNAFNIYHNIEKWYRQ